MSRPESLLLFKRDAGSLGGSFGWDIRELMAPCRQHRQGQLLGQLSTVTEDLLYVSSGSAKD